MTSTGSISNDSEAEDVLAHLPNMDNTTTFDPEIAASHGQPRPSRRMHRLSTMESQKFDLMSYNTRGNRNSVVSTPYHQQRLKRLSTRQTQMVNHDYNTHTSVPAINIKNVYEKFVNVIQLSDIAHDAIFNINNLLMICVYCAITATVLYAQIPSRIYTTLGKSAMTVGFFSSIMGFGLVFRLNICCEYQQLT